MFLSYADIKYLGYDKVRKRHLFQYKIVDTDFEEMVVGIGLGNAIIDIYERHNLNVARNLVLAFKWLSKTNDYSIQQLSESLNQKFSKYEKDFNKYLILM